MQQDFVINIEEIKICDNPLLPLMARHLKQTILKGNVNSILTWNKTKDKTTVYRIRQKHVQTATYKQFYYIIKVLIKDYQLHTGKKSKPGTYSETIIINNRKRLKKQLNFGISLQLDTY